jgi:hypothetical protein
VLANASRPLRLLTLLHGRLEPVDERSCLLRLGAETPRMLVYLLTVLDVDFTVESPAGSPSI